MEKTGEICVRFLYTRCDGMEKFEGINFEMVSLSNQYVQRTGIAFFLGSNALHLLMH